MIVVLTSIMRNACGYLDGYLAQIDDLQDALVDAGHQLIIEVAEGDSTDATYQQLLAETFRRSNLGVCKLDHGGPAFGSIDNPTRWQNIARTWNGLFERIKNETFDGLIYVEADLIWEPDTMIGLLNDLQTVPAVAPMSMHRQGFFYDTWGYRAGGMHFSANIPYHPMLNVLKPGELLQLDSAGSCKVMRAEVARTCRFSEQDAMLGHDINAKGYSLWLDPQYMVVHP